MPWKSPLTETESKLFCNKVLDPNRPFYRLEKREELLFFYNGCIRPENRENPSVATLDTLARYAFRGALYHRRFRGRIMKAITPTGFCKEKISGS